MTCKQARPGSKVVMPFLTHFADLTSWEYAQKLVKIMPMLEASGVQVIAVGLGSAANAQEFARDLRFPATKLFADPSGAAYKALGFNPGFLPDLDISPYAKLLPMLAGVGSEGTLQEVVRGYIGDRAAQPVFDRATPFDILGTGYQRPFELATLRLFNMVGVLSRCECYRTPPAPMAKPATGASRQSSLAVDREGERAKRLLAAADAYLKVKRGQPQPSIPAVAREHGVPYATLYRVINRGGVIAKRGRPTALSAVQEEQLRDLVVRGQQQGVGVTKTALLAAVRTTQRVMGRKGKVDLFKGKAPGKKWRQGFMRLGPTPCPGYILYNSSTCGRECVATFKVPCPESGLPLAEGGNVLSPPNQALLTQQGGTLAFDGQEVIFKHVDSGILKYTDTEALLRVVLNADIVADAQVLPAITDV
ncbi:hypothetical protein QJQ45_029825 [Haematococcus lacustris]|nr:hypothetical protein QJQ45_029825 [Haematococcus lacustris]